MNDSNKTKLKQAIDNDRVFDYIANNYHKFSKSELATIIKEYAYVISSVRLLKSEKKDITRVLWENLDEQFED